MKSPSPSPGLSQKPLQKREAIRVGQLTITFLLEPGLPHKSVAMFELLVPAGAKVPIGHFHDAYEETLYGLEGVLSFTLSGASVDVAAGDVLSIPRGAVHRFDNFGVEDAKLLVAVTPGLLGPEYFREIGAVIDAAAGHPPDPNAIAAVMLRHGLTPAP